MMLVCTLVARYLVPYLKQILENSKHDWVLNFVDVAVQAAEQTILGDKSVTEKKAIVTGKLKKLLIQKNIDITDEQLDMLIEAAVFNMKKE